MLSDEDALTRFINAAKKFDAVGTRVTCSTCGMTKKPIGRDAPPSWFGCHSLECGGWAERPYSTTLWPGETLMEYGYSGDDRIDELLTILREMEASE